MDRKRMDSDTIGESLLRALRNDPEFGPVLQLHEEIDKEVQEAVECVDLDIAFSPVLKAGAISTAEAITVSYKGADGRYVVKEPFQIIKAEDLRVMRARYLIINGREKQPIIDRMSRR